MPDIEKEFSNSLTIVIRASEEDIRKYLKSAVLYLPGFIAQRSDLQGEITQTISQIVDGMFLLAQLYCDSLIDKYNPTVLRKALQDLKSGSKSYTAAYDSAMKRIAGQLEGQAELAKQVLAWITCAQRPLTQAELQHALAVEVGEARLDEDNITQIHDIISVCAGLVTVDAGSDTVRLIHETTERYLEQTREVWCPNAHLKIAESCTAYLSFEHFSTGSCLSDEEFELRLDCNPLYKYSACNWGHHARRGSAYQETSLFLQKGAQIEAASQALLATNRCSRKGYSQRVPKRTTGLHLAAFFGLDRLLKVLLSTSDINVKDSLGQTALFWAARNGHAAAIATLLESGATTEVEDRYGGTCLWWAVRNGYIDSVKLLTRDCCQTAEVGIQDIESKPTRTTFESIILILYKYGEDVQKLLRWLENHFDCTGSVKDADRAVETIRIAAQIDAIDRDCHMSWDHYLSKWLGKRHLRTGSLTDADEAIQLARKAINRMAFDSVPADLSTNLGNLLRYRFRSTGSIDDLEESVHVLQQTLDLTPLSHKDRAGRLQCLGEGYSDRYQRTGAMADLEEAIKLGRQAIDTTPQDHPDRPARLNNLASCLENSYSRTGAMADLKEAIKIGRQAIDTTPQDHPDRPARLNNLASCLENSYSRTGAMADLEEAIEIGRQAIDTTPQDHPDRARWLNDLASYLENRYSRTGIMADLEEAIDVGRQAVNATPKDHPNRAGKLNNLASCLENRYSRTGAIADLEEAIEIGRQAVYTTPQDHPDRPARLNNLASCLENRYSRIGAMADLQGAIEIGRQAIDTTPQDHPDRARWLNDLASYLGNRYSRTGAMADLEEAIDVGRQAVDATPQDHPNRAGKLNNLANRLRDRYSMIGAIADLEEAIEIGRQAIDTTPQDHPDRARWLNDLASYLGNRYSRTGAMADLELSYCHSVDSLTQSTASTADRIVAGRRLLLSDWALRDTSNVINHASMVLELLPQLAPRFLQNADKQHLLAQAAGLASNAAAIALIMQQTPGKAVTWLEAGRSILSSGIQDLRTDIFALQQNCPDLAAIFDNIRAILAASFEVNYGDFRSSPGLCVGRQMVRRRQAHEEFEKIIQEIRNQPGFNHFLRPPTEDEILATAANDPIILINVSRHRCDALVVSPAGVQCVELSNGLYDDIQEYHRNVTTPSHTMLQWLWDCIVDPVLTQLGMLNSPPVGEQWPRVWWIPTGPLVGFPLHAAGYHLERQDRTALDRVVSSYATSLRSVTATMQRQQQVCQNTADGTKITLVAMENTPMQGRLHFTSSEIRAVQAVCESIGLQPVLPVPRKMEVLSALQTSSIFHFAGHGGTRNNPLQSLLFLEDWECDPLTVDELLQTNLVSQSPFLAYLAACGTGQMRHPEMLDENIHLAAACQLAGFRHVIGTLWSVDDSECVDMARLVYEFLQKEGMNDRAVREGLHRASRQLRDLWVLNEKAKSEVSNAMRSARDGELGDDSDAGNGVSGCWIPYVHYGA